MGFTYFRVPHDMKVKPYRGTDYCFHPGEGGYYSAIILCIYIYIACTSMMHTCIQCVLIRRRCSAHSSSQTYSLAHIPYAVAYISAPCTSPASSFLANTLHPITLHIQEPLWESPTLSRADVLQVFGVSEAMLFRFLGDLRIETLDN